MSTTRGVTPDLPEGVSVAGMLAILQVRPERVAVERNRLVVKRATFADTPVEEGDVIEILTFVGGG